MDKPTDSDAMSIAKKGIEEYGEALNILAGSLRNADDYDDWEYGTEPIPGDPTWAKRSETNCHE